MNPPRAELELLIMIHGSVAKYQEILNSIYRCVLFFMVTGPRTRITTALTIFVINIFDGDRYKSWPARRLPRFNFLPRRLWKCVTVTVKTARGKRDK